MKRRRTRPANADHNDDFRLRLSDASDAIETVERLTRYARESKKRGPREQSTWKSQDGRQEACANAFGFISLF
jgi:hypothetical protein